MLSNSHNFRSTRKNKMKEEYVHRTQMPSFIFFMSESNLDCYGHVRQDLLYGALMFTYFILQHLSTSPDQEPPHFEASVRAALVQIRDYPDPLKVMYPDGKKIQ
jgi:hypothetical protein